MLLGPLLGVAVCTWFATGREPVSPCLILAVPCVDHTGGLSASEATWLAMARRAGRLPSQQQHHHVRSRCSPLPASHAALGSDCLLRQPRRWLGVLEVPSSASTHAPCPGRVLQDRVRLVRRQGQCFLPLPPRVVLLLAQPACCCHQYWSRR